MILEILKACGLGIGAFMTLLGLIGLCSLFTNYSGTSWRIKAVLLAAGTAGTALVHLCW
ncbi:MAG: hypothetical protein RL292_433 [Candidatus Parcubacteria bacterium]|jgi:multisubunit Na+/H+ antiporter MnhG subunit